MKSAREILKEKVKKFIEKSEKIQYSDKRDEKILEQMISEHKEFLKNRGHKWKKE